MNSFRLYPAGHAANNHKHTPADDAAQAQPDLAGSPQMTDEADRTYSSLQNPVAVNEALVVRSSMNEA